MCLLAVRRLLVCPHLCQYLILSNFFIFANQYKMMSCFNLHSLIINEFEHLVSIQVFPFVACMFCPLSIFLLGFLF